MCLFAWCDLTPVRVLVAVLGLTLGACTATLPPAVPAEPTVFTPPPAPPETPPPPAVAPPRDVPDVPAPSPPPVRQAVRAPRRLSTRQATPETVIAAANTSSRLTPSRTGYAEGQSSVQRYPYVPGKLYDIYSSPNHPTTILLPPGERLAAPPTLNPDVWDVGVADMDGSGQRQEALIVRPVAAGHEATTPLLTHSGRVFFCRLRSLAQTSMVAVTWDVPHVNLPGLDAPQASQPTPETAPTPTRQGPLVDLAHLHTAYTIEKTSGNPPWIPLAVYDDGSTTFIRFKEVLSYTAAPAVFVRHADGTPGVVAFTPYTVPGMPEKGAYYLVQGLWPQLELRGSDGQTVRLTRLTGQPTPYQAVHERR